MYHLTPLGLAQTQLDAYNAQDLEKFLSCYSDDVQMERDDGTPALFGKESMRKRYADIFESFPQNQAVLMGRIHVGPWVFDSEMVIGRGSEPLFVVARYLIKDGLISKVAFFSEHPAL